MAQQLFKLNAAKHVIAAKMPPDQASMHLDTIFTFCDRDLVTIYEPAVNNITHISYRPGDGADDGADDDAGEIHVTVEEKGWLGWEWLYSIYFVIIIFTVIGYGDRLDHPTNKDADHFRRIKLYRGSFTAP